MNAMIYLKELIQALKMNPAMPDSQADLECILALLERDE